MCFTDTAAQASLINSRALQTHTLLLGPPSPGSACAAPQLLGPVAWVTALLDTPTQCGARIERLLYAGHGRAVRWGWRVRWDHICDERSRSSSVCPLRNAQLRGRVVAPSGQVHPEPVDVARFRSRVFAGVVKVRFSR